MNGRSLPIWSWAALATGGGLVWLIFSGAYRFTDTGASYFPLFEDGMISLEYAQSFAATGKFTVGGSVQQTAGFTSFVWVLLLAALQLVSQSTEVVVALNFVLLFATLAVYSTVLKELGTSRKFETLAWAMVLTAPPVVFWSCRGMEVPLAMLFQALVLTTCVRVLFIEKLQRPYLIALHILVAATPFVRPDLTAFSAAVAVGTVAFRRSRLALGLAVALLVGAGAYLGTNMVLFDQPLSTSYYLKIMHVPLAVRIERVLDIVPGVLYRTAPFLALFVGGIAACLAWLPKDGRLAGILTFLSIASAGIVAGWVYAGGDAWEEFRIVNRFLTPLIPIAAFAAAMTHGRTKDKCTAGALRVAMVCMGALTLFNLVHVINLFGYGALNDYKFSKLGLLLGQVMPPGTTAMHYWYGQPSYYSAQYGVRSIDGLGKIEVKVARTPPKLRFKPGHDRWNHEYSLGTQKPDLIVNLPCPVSYDPAFDCDAVWREITDRYGYRPYTSPGGEVTLFVRPDRPRDLSGRVLELNGRLAQAMATYPERRRLRGLKAFLFQ